jgi:hydroxymethylbilane synthase
MHTLRLGTRRSALALAQSQMMAAAVEAANPGIRVELAPIVTVGDAAHDRAFDSVGAVGMFVREIEQALLDGLVDFAVHSLKDLPTIETPGLVVAAVPERATPWDVLLTARAGGLEALPTGARIGTGSPRRAAQLRALRPDLVMEPLRGNVDTRVKRLEIGDFDGILLAAAGLERLGFLRAGDTDVHGLPITVLPPDLVLPAVGQGALALQCRAGDAETRGRLIAVEHAPTRLEVTAERALLAALGGGCHVPIAGFARAGHRDAAGGPLRFVVDGFAGDPEGRTPLRDRLEQPAADVTDVAAATSVGRAVARRLYEAGAGKLLGLTGLVGG